jgi:glycosyltransferase involved in cell wall biosynthesis
VEAGDLAGLRSALQRILTDQTLRDAMARNNRQRAMDCYDVDTSATKLLHIYQRLLATGS